MTSRICKSTFLPSLAMFLFALAVYCPSLTSQTVVSLGPPTTKPDPPAGSTMSASTCNAACNSAISKEALVVGFSGNSSNVAMWDQTDSRAYTNSGFQRSSVANPPIAPYNFLGVSSSSYVASVLMDITQQTFYSQPPSSFNASMQNGFTIGLMVYVEDPAATTRSAYYSFPPSNNAGLFYIERYGSQWGLALTTTQGSTLEQIPWDANSFQSGPGWNYVFYTVTPDNKVRIDIFSGSIYSSAILDLGNLISAYTAGTSTSNPSTPSAQSQNGNYAFSLLQGRGFEAIAMFRSPLSPAEVSGFYQASYQGSYGDSAGVACNTGYALNVTTVGSVGPTPMPATPCGNTSNWSNTKPPQ
jgi:hypothetical protein